MPKTKAELIARALRARGEVGSGQSPEPEDFTAAKGDLGPVVELLFERRIVDARFILTVGDTVPIVPDAWFLPLARCLAFYGADESLSAEYQTLAAVSEASQETFHQMVDASDSDVPVRALYF